MEIDNYTVTVDYELSTEEMVAAGNYDDTGCFNEKNFPPECNPSLFLRKGGGVVKLDLKLVHLMQQKYRAVNTEEVEVYLEERDLRAATFEELLAFGTKYPEKQREFPIVAFGSSCVTWERFLVRPFLSAWEEGKKRILVFSWSYRHVTWYPGLFDGYTYTNYGVACDCDRVTRKDSNDVYRWERCCRFLVAPK